MAEETKEISIQDLQRSLEVYEIESQQKLEQLKKLFADKGSLDVAKMFYEQRSSIEIKFQNIIDDLVQFLVEQQVPATEKLRKIFFRILQNPLLLLFKVSKFEILKLRFEGFDIEIEPIDAILELSKSVHKNIDEYLSITSKQFQLYNGKQYKSWQSFLEQATLFKIQLKIFLFYSYLRKGAPLLKKKFQYKVQIVDGFNSIQMKLLPILLKKQDTKTVKQLSILNHQIYQLEPSFDVLYFYIHIPLIERYKECFQELQFIGAKAKQTSNYNVFILHFIKHDKEVLEKLKNQKVDPFFKTFIENALTSILQLWGCRICYYRQFCNLFIALFQQHPDKIKALELALEHNPQLTKDDVVLLRSNFKLQIEKKNNQLLTLLKSMNMEQINQFLNNFYHRTLYNMEFKGLEREKIISLLTLMNGNSSLAQFFAIAERAFKEWNHTIDFNHSHKFIESQFVYPKVSQSQVKQSLSLLTNLCSLEQKGFTKEYQSLIRAGTIGKSLVQFVKFIQRDQKSRQILSWPQTSKFLLEALNFLRKGLNPVTQTQNIALTFSTVLDHIKQQGQRNTLQSSLIAAIQDNVESFHIKECLDCFKRYKTRDLSKVIDLFMEGVSQNNQMIKKFQYLDQNVEQLKSREIPEDDCHFIANKYRINRGRLVFKDPGIFNISDLQVMTIPSQIDKVIDNYFFTLDSNSKKFIEYLVQVWNLKRQQKNPQFSFYSDLLQSLVQRYPISIPLLCNVRLNTQKGSIRFIQLICNQIRGDDVYCKIVEIILRCKCIRYKNGKDYIQQQIIPMGIKQLIQIINSQKNDEISSQKLLILSKLIQRSNINQINLETIQKIIEKIRFLLINCFNSSKAQIYAQSFTTLMTSFFAKKELELKRQKLVQGYNNLIWSDARNYISNNENKSDIKDCKITQYIAVSPFTVTQQFNIDEYKIKKIKKKVNKVQKLIKINQILQKLPIFQADSLKFSFSSTSIPQNRKKIYLNNLKYDLNTYLGRQNVEDLEDKQNVDLIFNSINKQQKRQRKNKKKEQDTNNFILYYMKLFSMPSIHHQVILHNVTTILQSDNPSISFLWTNNQNLQHYFIDFLSIFQFACLQSEKRVPEKDPAIKRIVQLVNADSLGVRKKIIKIFTNLGYSNIWAQKFDIFWTNFPISRLLGFNKKIQQSFFSVFLQKTLKNQSLRTELVQFLGKLFSTRSDQNALMLKVILNKQIMNNIMLSLSIPHLQKISLMFHSNFQNQRLFTEQLHEGLRSLNICSRVRTYIQYIKISKQIEQQQFTNCMKLFKQNFRFFIRIQKQGYKFKKSQQTNLLLTRLSNFIRNTTEGQNISSKVNQFMDQYIKQISLQQQATANRVKSFYLVTKLRDLSYQNSLMISILHQVMHSSGKSQAQIIQQINKLEIFSLMNKLYNDLVRYEDDWRNIQKYSSRQKIDGYVLENQLAICSTLRFSHSMSKVYNKSELEYDQILQRCIDALKGFFITQIGNKWLQSIDVYPAFLTKSFIDHTKANKLTNEINQKLKQFTTTFEFAVQDNQLIQGLIKGFRSAPRSSFISKGITINYNNSKTTPIDMLKPLQERLSTNQTFVTLKTTGNIIFNKYKSSQATLEQIEVLGYIISYALLNKLPLQLNLHPSIISALSFNIAEVDYLLDTDFKLWQQIRNVLTIEDSGNLGLNFSRNFESIQNFKPVRIQLVDKGSSKKVNNKNRQSYADLLACYVFYQQVKCQISRLLTTILSIVPKQLISSTSTKQILNIFYNKQKCRKIMDQLMRKIGVVFPQTLIDQKGKRIQNLKDFQNVQWLQDLILENQQLRNKYWKDQTNIFIVTTIGPQGSVKYINGKFLIQHFNSKQDMRKALTKI